MCDNLLGNLTELSKEERKNIAWIPQQDKSWISERTFMIMREKTEARKKGEDEEIKRLGKEVRRSLRKDRRNRITKTADQIEECIKKKTLHSFLTKIFDTKQHIIEFLTQCLS